MLLGEPPPTSADLHFRLFGFPVRIHPFFWLITVLLAVGGIGSDEKIDPVDALIWVAVVLVSILVHELGHAFSFRYFGGRPRITLYGLGGLASCDDFADTPRNSIVIALAGPVAGFLLAGVIVLLLVATGHFVGFRLSLIPVIVRPFDPGAPSPRDLLVFYLLYVNIAWGLVNLLPIYPLDGGRVARELLTLGHPRQGIIRSLQLSIGAAALMAVYGFVAMGSFFIAFMFGYLAYINYQTLQAYRGRY